MLVLDSLEDPQNVGTLLRSAEAAGVHGVVFPTRRQAPLTPAAIKASAGAVEHLLLVPVDDLAGALADLHARGLRVAGVGGRGAADRAPGGSARTARDRRRQRGSGSRAGRPPALRPRSMRIPMRGAVGSLNAAVAGLDPAVRGGRAARPEGRSQPRTAVPWPSLAVRRGPGCRRPEAAADDAERRRRRRRAPRREPAAAAGRTGGRRARRRRRRCPRRRPPRTLRRRSTTPSVGRDRPAPGCAARRQAAAGQTCAPTQVDLSRGAPAGPTLDPSRRPALSSPGADGSSAVWPCPSRRRSSIGRAAVL